MSPRFWFLIKSMARKYFPLTCNLLFYFFDLGFVQTKVFNFDRVQISLLDLCVFSVKSNNIFLS